MAACIRRLLWVLPFFAAVTAAGQSVDAALAKLSQSDRDWVNRSCPRTLGPSLWSGCIIRESGAITAGRPDLSKLTQAEREWIDRSCPDSLGPGLSIGCTRREKAAIEAGIPNLSSLPAAKRQWIQHSCSTTLGPSLYRSCVRRELVASDSTRAVPAQPPAVTSRPKRNAYAGAAASRRTRSDSYLIEVSHNDELFIINGEKFEAQTYCFNMDEGDEVIFIDGSAFGACASAKILNLRTREICEVWCE